MFAEEDPPEYNVTERLRQLNEELAQEDEPNDERERSIKFKETLVDLVAPPPDYPTDEEETGEEVANPPETKSETKDQDAADEVEVVQVDPEPIDHKLSAESKNDEKSYEVDEDWNSDDDKGEENNNDNKSADQNEVSPLVPKSEKLPDMKPTGDYFHATNPPPVKPKSNQSKDKQEKILVERDGTFELINTEDLTAEERELYLASNAGDSASTTRSSGSFEPTPPKEPRPYTASLPSSRRKIVVNVAPRRAQSARAKRADQPVLEDFNYTSPYALTEEQKREAQMQRKATASRERKQKELAKLEEEEKNRENNEAFQAWLANKRKELANKRQNANAKQKEKEKAEEDKQKVIVKEYVRSRFSWC